MSKLASALANMVLDAVVAVLLLVFGWGILEALGFPHWTYSIWVLPGFAYIIGRLKDPAWKSQAAVVGCLCALMAQYEFFRENWGIPVDQPRGFLQNMILVGIALFLLSIGEKTHSHYTHKDQGAAE